MKKRIYESEEVQGQSQGEKKPAPGNEGLSQIIGLPYQQFVMKLKGLASDSKVQAVINAGKTDGKQEDEAFQFQEIDFDVKTLRPLQNEIDMDNSLKFPLSGASKQLEDMLRGTPVQILGPVVVYNYSGQDYIVDGHHRWSQVYAINKDGKIKGIRLTAKSKVDPRRILKATQMAIAAIMKEVPTASAKGVNLLTISEDALKDYIKSGKGSLGDKPFQGLQENVVKRFQSVKSDLSSVDAISNFIWQNVVSMKQTSGELWKKLNIKRDYMPQTDLGASGNEKDPKTKETVKKMVSGTINFLSPSEKDIVEKGKEVNEEKLIKSFERFIQSRR